MAKKKGALGKLLALTTTVAAIGGICYIFKDKIADSSLYKSASDKAGDIYGSVKNRFNSDDDFLFDDWDDDFDDDLDDDFDNSTREYTTLASSKDATDDTKEKEDGEDSIPTIDLSKKASDNKSEDTAVEKDENEGLSDTYEDPDVLEEQDKLDF